MGSARNLMADGEMVRSCAQITLTGGGTANPTGIALPGAYQPADVGVSSPPPLPLVYVLCTDET